MKIIELLNTTIQSIMVSKNRYCTQ